MFLKAIVNPAFITSRNSIQINLHFFLRSVSTSSAKLHKFVVYAPDESDPHAFQRRLAVRTQHLERANGLVQEGFIKVAGALLTPESIAEPTMKPTMIGSMFVCEADSLDTVRRVMESDIYYTSSVWDKEKLAIHPFVPVTQFP